MDFIRGYMRDDARRAQLNALTQKVFGFDFEDWFSGGYFEDEYIPYSYAEDGRLRSNASANIMDFTQLGEKRRYIQIGTVMTDEAYRNRGLAGRLIERILADYEGGADGVYLFANPDAAGFYEKLGFKRGLEYRYSIERSAVGCAETTLVPAGPEHRERYQALVRSAAVQSSFEQINKFSLQMFYTANLENVWYAKDLDAYAVLEREGDAALVQSIVCEHPVSVREILARIPFDFDRAVLGFVPKADERKYFAAEPFDGGDDYVFFYRGEALESIERRKLIFPALSHA